MPSHLESVLAGPVGASLQARATSSDLELPVLPETATEVLALCSGDSSDARELALKIERDQSLASHVLRVSNSSAYAPHEPIVSLQQAVARLGFATLCEITLAVAIKGNVFHVPGFQSTLADLWQHSAVSAAFAKEIARSLRKNVEGAFLCGLLHDIGKPVALQLLVNAWAEADMPDELGQELVEGVMNKLSGTLGGTLLKRWDFAPWMQAAVEFSHEPQEAGEFKEQARMTFLADELANWALAKSGATEESLLSLQVLGELELYDDELEKILARKEAILAVAESFS